MFDFSNEQCFRFLSELLASLKSTNQQEKILSLAIDRLVRMYHCQTCAVILIDPKTEYLHVENSHGLSLTFCNAFRRRIATAAIGRLLWTGQPVFLPDAAQDAQLAGEVRLEHPFGSCACVQIAADQRTLGYLHVDGRVPGAFLESDLGVLQVFADIMSLALVKATLFEENLRLERVDHETGLEKYLPFLEKLRVGIERAQEFRENFAILLFDVDNFKDTTNTYGYDASRALLKEMGDIIKLHTRTVDAAGRYGFDEFIMLMANTDLDHAVGFAQTMLKEIESQSFTNQGIRSTLSAGIAAYPQNGISAEDLLTTVKRALFEAQRQGRNTVHFFRREWYTKEPA